MDQQHSTPIPGSGEAGSSPSLDRYSRQIRFAPLGLSGQRKLAKAHVAVIGMGALGSVIAQHLVRSGIGSITIIDRDIVEWSNLQRQMLYAEQDAAELLPKVEAAARRLRQINGSVSVLPIAADLTAANAEELLSGADLLIDGTDNFSVRYLINDYSVKHQVPWIYGGAVGASGMTMTVIPEETACYRCLFPDLPPPGTSDTCETAGVISPVVDIIGSVQATEAIKWLSGNKQALHRTLFQVDLWNHSWLPLAITQAKRSDCRTCGGKQFDFLDNNSEEPVFVALCGRESVHVTPGGKVSLDLRQIADRLSAAGTISLNSYLLKLDIGKNMTFVLFSDGRAIIQGTDNPTKARSIYAEFLGI